MALLKKNGGDIDSRNTFGLTALHIAIWRNHLPIVKRLLAAGANPDVRVSQLSALCCCSIVTFLPSHLYMSNLYMSILILPTHVNNLTQTQ